MFNRLKIQLTLMNLILLSSILFLIFTGMFLFIKKGVETESSYLMNRIIRRGRSPKVSTTPRIRIVLSSAFYIRTDQNGGIIRLSPNIPFSLKDARSLLQKTDHTQKRNGRIIFNGVPLKFQKSRFRRTDIYVFLDSRPEKGVLSWFFTASLAIGGFSLILVAIVSLYLANRALVPIKTAWEKQKNFIADASHELRSPIAVIQTNLDLVRTNRDETVESQSKWLENIAYECGVMSKLVSDLLLLARADTRERPEPMARFLLSDALREAVVPFEPVAADKGIALNVRIEPRVFLYGNEARIKQMATIFLDNALKYSSEKDCVDFAMNSMKNSVEITVSDTGIGISKDDLQVIFERFYRADKARHRGSGGSGLGLAIADCIVQEHGGSIHVSSAVGRGSRFTILLPKEKSGANFRLNESNESAR